MPAGEPVAQPRATRASTRSNPNTDDTFDSSRTPSHFALPRKRWTKGQDHTRGLCPHQWRIVSVVQGFYPRHFQPRRQTVLTVKRVLQIPRTYADAITSPERKEWKLVINKEMKRLQDHGVYELVPITSVPHDNKIIGSRFVSKQKTAGRFKVRFVVRGYFQEPGIDYGKLYEPVCRTGSTRI